MSDLMKMEYPNFIKTKIIVTVTDEEEPKKIKCRINPFHITSYHYSFYRVEGKIFDATAIYVGGAKYTVDMTIEEVDDMMDNIDKGISIKE